MFNHLLVPTDGSELSNQTVKRAISFAKASNAKVTFFYARPNTAADLYGETALLRTLDPKLLEKAIHENANGILAKADALAKAAGIQYDLLSTASNGEPFEGIIAAATDRKCDLILMASHGNHGVKSLLIGSQTQKVLTYSKIPVLVYR